MSLADLFNPPHIQPAAGRLFIDGKPASASDIVHPVSNPNKAAAQRSYYNRNKAKESSRKRAYRERCKAVTAPRASTLTVRCPCRVTDLDGYCVQCGRMADE